MNEDGDGRVAGWRQFDRPGMSLLVYLLEDVVGVGFQKGMGSVL